MGKKNRGKIYLAVYDAGWWSCSRSSCSGGCSHKVWGAWVLQVNSSSSFLLSSPSGQCQRSIRQLRKLHEVVLSHQLLKVRREGEKIFFFIQKKKKKEKKKDYDTCTSMPWNITLKLIYVLCVCGRGCSLNNNKIRTQSSEQKRSTSSRKKKWVKDNLDSALLLFD